MKRGRGGLSNLYRASANGQHLPTVWRVVVKRAIGASKQKVDLYTLVRLFLMSKSGRYFYFYVETVNNYFSPGQIAL